MPRRKGRERRQSTPDDTVVYARVGPDAKAALTRASTALGVSDTKFLEELLIRAAGETHEGVPSWVLEQLKAKKDTELQLALGLSA